MSGARLAAERELPTLPPEIARLPVAHLHLQGRAASLATAHETIGAIFASNAASQSRESGALQIRRVLDALLAAVTHDRCNGWDSFRRTRPPLIERSTIFLYSPRLQRLNKATAMSPVARLHLSRRAINSLAAVGISNLEQLVRGAAAGIRDVAALGPLTALEISESLDAVAYSVRDDGSVDWMSYAELRGFDLLPAKAQESYSGRDF